MGTNKAWRVSRWNSHKMDSVVVDDDDTFCGLRLIAECDTPETARLLAAAPEMADALQKLLEQVQFARETLENREPFDAAMGALLRARGLK